MKIADAPYNCGAEEGGLIHENQNVDRVAILAARRWMNPKSQGKLMPCGNMLLNRHSPFRSSNLYLLRHPFGVSMTTFRRPDSGFTTGNLLMCAIIGCSSPKASLCKKNAG